MPSPGAVADRLSSSRVGSFGLELLYHKRASNPQQTCLLVPTRQELVQTDGASAVAPRQLEDVQLFRGLSRVRISSPVEVARVSLADRSVEATAVRRRRCHACVELETVSSGSSHWLRGKIHHAAYVHYFIDFSAPKTGKIDVHFCNQVS